MIYTGRLPNNSMGANIDSISGDTFLLFLIDVNVLFFVASGFFTFQLYVSFSILFFLFSNYN